MALSSSEQHEPHSLGRAIERLSRRWGWVVAAGGLIIAFGVFALALALSATIASVFLIGFFMILAGLFEIVIGIASRRWSRFFLWIAAGFLYAIVGAAALAEPLFAAIIFTLVLGAGLVATGAMRLWIAVHLPRRRARQLKYLSGAATIVLGVAILVGWPADSLFALGLLLGLELIFRGAGWIGFGLILHAHRHHD
ncbi:MAG TPA: DUF308 domain-containing protein [Beijerinckiaceae bacterium]|jgi:uncharacterized membrane protein HdeD (DUF308 family)|nr:DUF308 domain-containing protein [Beijerinckiaceae bacterium]